MEKCYTVAETVKLTGVKSYVLRYWEDELSLPIRRNELGIAATPRMIFNCF